jgi:hypothetical protein
MRSEALRRVVVPLNRDDQHHRLMYGFPRFITWLTQELPSLQAGRMRSSDTPYEQVDNIIYRWIAGKEIIYDRMFKDLMPMIEEVWELKTVDTRIFGWMYRPRIFIAVFGDYADLYKGRNVSATYVSARNQVKDARAGLDIDEPKFATGHFDDLVCV